MSSIMCLTSHPGDSNASRGWRLLKWTLCGKVFCLYLVSLDDANDEEEERGGGKQNHHHFDHQTVG